MKNPLKLSLLFVCILFISSACNKDPFSQDPGDLPDGTIVCKVDGAEFETVVGTAVIASPLGGETLFTIQGFESIVPIDADYVQITYLVLDGFEVEDLTYSLGDTLCSPVPQVCGGFVFKYANETESYAAGVEIGAGAIEIIAIDYQSGGRVTGRFSGTLVQESTGNEVTVTEGKFNMKIL